MLIWDEEKAATNLTKHGVAFQSATSFDWKTALIVADRRTDYGEDRYLATGKIGSRLHVLTYTIRGDDVRVISLRKANVREIRTYDQNQA